MTENHLSASECQWCLDEFATVKLQDARLNRRCSELAVQLAMQPSGPINQACEDWADTKAAYRFFEDEKHTMEKILTPHYESTQQRIQQQKVALAVQDSTSLKYSTHPATKGLGSLSTNQDAIGLLLHNTMAFNTDKTPLGLLDVQCWARDPEEYGKNIAAISCPSKKKKATSG